MTTENIKADMSRWIEALNARDMNLLDQLADELYAADYTLHDPGMPDFGRGPEGVKQFTRQILQDNSEIDMTIEDMFGGGDKLATRMTVRFTNAATGNQVSFPIFEISRMAGGKFAEEWELVGPAAAD